MLIRKLNFNRSSGLEIQYFTSEWFLKNVSNKVNRDMYIIFHFCPMVIFFFGKFFLNVRFCTILLKLKFCV